MRIQNTTNIKEAQCFLFSLSLVLSLSRSLCPFLTISVTLSLSLNLLPPPSHRHLCCLSASSLILCVRTPVCTAEVFPGVPFGVFPQRAFLTAPSRRVGADAISAQGLLRRLAFLSRAETSPPPLHTPPRIQGAVRGRKPRCNRYRPRPGILDGPH